MLWQVILDQADGTSPQGVEGTWAPDAMQPSFSLAYVQIVM